uniref:thrombospondin type-1 domain-containing protein 4-like n=1 Tax=Pristiophorus japonicus TaxID=55135 RepID=UPI00398E58D2
MRDRQRWMRRFCWVSVFLGFHCLTILQCSYTHRKVPQRKPRQAADGIAGVWSPWGPWSPCSSTCGIGVAQQSRRCLPREPESPGWAVQPRGAYQRARTQPGESPWAPYSGRAVSALRPAYPLHLDSAGAAPPFPHGRTQQDPSGPHSLPLYDDGQGNPANGASPPLPPTMHQGYGQAPTNRGSVHLYRQPQPSNHDRPRLPPNGVASSPYGTQSLTAREFGPLYTPETSSRQSSGSQPRQRSTAPWRVSTGNRRSLMRQEVHSSNRSRSRGVIRPGQYGYGKVPSNFRLQGTIAHLQQETPRNRQGHHGSSQQPRLPEAAALSERKGRAQRGAGEGEGDWRSPDTQGQNWQNVEGREAAQVRERGRRSAAEDETGPRRAPGAGPIQISFVRPPNRARGDQLEGRTPEQAGGDHRQVGLGALATSHVFHRRPHEQGRQGLNFTSPLLVYQAVGEAESLAGVLLETKGESHSQTSPGRRSAQMGTGPEPQRWARASGGKGKQRASPDPEPPRGEPAAGAASGSPAHSTPAKPGIGPGGSPRSAKSPSRKGLQEDLQNPRQRFSRRRRQGYRLETDPTADIQGQAWNAQQWPSAVCPGAERQYKTCSVSACPSGDTDPRKAQCSGFNHLQFMGRYYEWEPFTEVRKDQRCELNCRPAGYRFYVRHADQVVDGTPCESNSSDVCVGGRCLTPGCDGTLGSASRPDKCGVCGGDGSSCELVFGTFEDTQVNVGYHKIIEIPSGAININVTEMARSRNYLALRSRSGRSIINGNWAIDRPGKYEAAGTMFMYKRPTETSGESFYAEGPTTESLDVYIIFQQENPGIHYEFVLPVETPPLPPQTSHHVTQSYGSRTTEDRREVSALGSAPVAAHQGAPVTPRARGGQRDRRLQVYHTDAQEDPVRRSPVHRWASLTATECSASCGKGFLYPIFRCVAQDSQEVLPDSHCNPGTKPASVGEACNTQPCPAFWSVGDWSQCSKSCGPGIHHRQVLCRQAYANRTVAVHPHRCGHLDKPNATQPCQARACTHWQIQTDWESCSVPCGVGQRKRSIRCVSNQGDVLGEGECSGKQKPTDSEACDMGPCVKAWFSTDWSNQCSVECGVGVQKRSVLCLSSYGRSPESCEGPRPPETRACARGRCEREVRWYSSPWSQCPVQCGNGTQNRDLICVIKLGSNFTVTVPTDCAHLDKPPSVQPCSAGPCGARWFTTGWSECSKSCMGGLQAREVRCLDNVGFPSNLCDAAARPDDQRMCHTHPCIPELDENCKDKYYNCPVVVQARLCVYSYYKMVCCASCTHAERKTNDLRRHDTSGWRGAA